MCGRHHTRHSCWQLHASGRPVLHLQHFIWEGIKNKETQSKCQIHMHTSFRGQEVQDLTRSPVPPLPLSAGVIPCCCGFICFPKSRRWTQPGNSLCTTIVLYICRDKHLLTLVCVPTPCFSTETKVGTRKSGFLERWTAELGSTEKPEPRLKSQAPKDFSIHHLGWSLAIVQIQTKGWTQGKRWA